MEEKIDRVKAPVQREGAEKYLLITLLSFAASVSLTRLFLELTGYPQLGNSELHIAHVLWGGLFLYIAALIPLLYANRWVYTISAALGGIGIGLFIDEVGKFITQSNDYFYPPAAPIIYIFFLLTVLLYRRTRRAKQIGVRTELYRVLDGFEEILDHDLSDRERTRLIQRLEKLEIETQHPDMLRLIQTLRDYILTEDLYTTKHVPNFMEKTQIWLKAQEDRWINRKGLRIFLAGGLIAMAVWVLYYPGLVAYQYNNPGEFDIFIRELVDARVIATQTGLNWFGARLLLQAAIGVLLFVSSILMLAGLDRQGIGLSYLGLLLSLTAVTLLMFYFDQFSTITSALFQFALFMTVMYYRRRYLEENDLGNTGDKGSDTL